jgi:hypothetical protein
MLRGINFVDAVRVYLQSLLGERKVIAGLTVSELILKQ